MQTVMILQYTVKPRYLATCRPGCNFGKRRGWRLNERGVIGGLGTAGGNRADVTATTADILSEHHLCDYKNTSKTLYLLKQ